MYLENTILYGDKGEVPAEEYLIPLGKADIKREGTDLTIISYGRAVIQSLAAAHLLQQEHNISAEVVDLRSIRPLDMDTVLASVRKTHRVLVVEEQKPFCGVGAQLAFMIQSEAFDELDAPIARLSHDRRARRSTARPSRTSSCPTLRGSSGPRSTCSTERRGPFPWRTSSRCPS